MKITIIIPAVKIRHCFFGEYSEQIALVFDDENDCEMAQRNLNQCPFSNLVYTATGEWKKTKGFVKAKLSSGWFGIVGVFSGDDLERIKATIFAIDSEPKFGVKSIDFSEARNIRMQVEYFDEKQREFKLKTA